jgi:hypothetical protein
MKNQKKSKAMKNFVDIAGSWGRAALAAAIAYYLATGDMTVKGLLSAAIAAVLPPILRYIDPKDPLGRG